MTVTSTATITSRSYITIGGSASNEGLRFISTSGSGISAASGANYIIIQNNYLENKGGSCLRFATGESSDIQILRNTMYRCGRPDTPTDLNASIMAGGQRFLIDGNDISASGDCIYIQGSSPTRSVIRNNYCHNFDSVGTGEHIDGIQLDGAAGTLSETLIENNKFDTCVDTTGANDCHIMLFQNLSFPAAENLIIRHNYGHSWASGLGLGSPSPVNEITYMRAYHNTLATEALGTFNGGGILVFEASHNGKFINNIFYNVMAGASSRSPTLTSGTVTGTVWNSNVVYTAGYTGGWGSPYSTEATYNTLRNVNPQFANYPNTAELSASSTLINAAVPLTIVATADTGSGTTLIANDARFFYAFTNIPGVQADCIAIGTVSNTACISSINYATNTITLTNSITRNDGDNIWLYKDSDGTQVLYGSAPDIGAYEFVSATAPPPPPPPPPGPEPLAGDLNTDHIVNALDWSMMNQYWGTSNATADLNSDGTVNTLDYSILNANWFGTW